MLAAEVLEQMAGTLAASAAALRDADQARADEVLERARAGESVLTGFSTAAEEGLSVVRYSPFRRHQLPGVQAFAELYDPLDHANRNLRVLARRCAVALWREERVPAVYPELMEQLAEVVGFVAAELHARRLPTRARDQLVAVGERTAHVELASSISGVVILAQVRSMTADLLGLTGVDYAEARQLIPEVA